MSGKNEENLLADVERGEVWLRGSMADHPVPDGPSLEHMKLRVRIAVHERFVDFGEEPRLSRTAVNAIRRSVRRGLVRQTAKGNPAARSVRSWTGWALTGVAAAAMIAIVVTPTFWAPPAKAPIAQGSPPPVVEEVDLLSATAGTAYDQEIQAIESALEELEDVAGTSLFSSLGQQTSGGGAEDDEGGISQLWTRGSVGLQA